MKKEVGTSAGILALLAVLLHTQFPGSQETSVSQTSRAAAGPTRDKQQRPEDEAREGPWTATRAFFNQGEAPRPGEELKPKTSLQESPCGSDDVHWALTCLTSLDEVPPQPEKLLSLFGIPAAEPNNYRMWSIVASLADPFHTRLPLFLDHQIEAILKSSQNAGWEFATQWLPWKDRLQPGESDISARRHQRFLQRDQERLPGVLIFRRFTRAAPPLERQILFIFVVPETPISGISGPPFFAAMHMASVLSTNSHVGLLAPSFSGSFESLTILVNAWNNSPSLKLRGAKLMGPAYGGNISSSEHASIFTQRTGMSFHSGNASTIDKRDAFCKLLKKYNIQPADAAYLEEDETAFGADYAKPDDNNPLLPTCTSVHYTYPRDISHLRNIYQDEVASTSPNQKAQPSAGVNFSIKDPDSGEDSVPTFSDVQTPLSQSAIVDRILDEFQRKRIRIAYIAATNPLDAIFLARVVRHESPDTRVMLGEPDVLFVPAASQERLTGTLFLSAYPMFFEGDDWLPKDVEHRRTEKMAFSDPTFEGLYNVTQKVLSDLGAINKGGSRSYPGMWLLTLNRSGFLPVDLTFQLADAVKNSWFVDSLPSGIQPKLPTPPRGWFITAISLTAFICWGCFLLLRNSFYPSRGWPLWLTFSPSHPITQGSRLIAITLCALALSATEWILFLPVWIHQFAPPLGDRMLSWWRPWTASIGVIGFAMPLLCVLWLWKKKISLPASFTFKGLFYIVSAICLFVLTTAAWAWSCRGLGSPADFLFSFRALELYSGSSPALPLVFLGLGTAAGLLLYLKRFTRAGFARPVLSLESLDETAPFSRHYEATNQEIVAPAQLDLRTWVKRIGYSGLLLLLYLFVFRPWRYASAFENLPYNAALITLVSVLLIALAATCFDLCLIWRNLESMVNLIDLYPLRKAFERVASDWPRRPIWAPLLLPKTLVGTQMVRALHKRWLIQRTEESKRDLDQIWDTLPTRFGSKPGAYPLPPADKAHSDNSQDAPPRLNVVVTGATAAQLAPEPEIQQTLQAEPVIIDFLHACSKHEVIRAELATKILVQDLRPIGRASFTDAEIDLEKESSSAEGHSELQKCCADFVALQFSRYVAYVVTQLQTIAWCLSGGLVLLMIVLNSYSPQAPLLLGRFLAALFVLLGAVVFHIFAAMERNAIISRISGTEAGELNHGFWLQILIMGVLPLFGVLVHLFPSISGLFYSWVAPGVEALR